jgi:shikimate dehydrogenase
MSVAPLLVSSSSRVLAIIGEPIGHSISPRIQNAAWRVAGEDCVLIACRVAPPKLREAVLGAQAWACLA